jgi:PAS domain S-box-containing protein
MAWRRENRRNGKKPWFTGLSIGSIFVCAVIAVSTLFLGVWAVIEYLTLGIQMRSKLESGLALEADRMAASLGLSLWGFDYPQTDAIALSTMGNREIASIGILPAAAGQQPRFYARDGDWTPVKSDGPSGGGEEFSAAREIRAKDHLVGTLRVEMTSRFLQDELRAATLRLGLAVGILDLLLIAALNLLLWLLVLRPLVAMGAYAADISLGRSAALQRDWPGHEFSMVSQALGRMVGLLEKRYSEMEASERRFKVLFEHAPDAILEVNGETGLIQGANGAAQALLGPDASDEGARISGLFPGEDGAAALRAGMEAALRGESAGFEAKLRVASRGETLCAVNVTPLPTSGSERVLRLSMVDIGEKRGLEERLRHAERMDAIGQLAGGVAHDFNNQLGGILGYAELLSETASDGEQKEWVQGIVNSAKRAAGLTRQLLAYARRGKYQREPVDVHALCRETAELLNRSIDKRIRISLDLAAAGSTVLGDPSQLQNALLNLAINARDAMPDGGLLSFSTESARPDQAELADGMRDVPCVAVRVADTGTGMSDATKAHLFEPYFTTKEAGKGTGLGLAAVYGTARNHQGAVRVESELGKGTSMTLILPLATEDAGGSGSADAEQPARASGGAVMLIDDEEAIRRVGGKMIESLGYEPIVCWDADSAYRAFEGLGGKVELVIMDMIMPGTSGKEIFTRLRALDPEVRVLIASGYALDGDARALLESGALGFIQKPFAKAQLGIEIGRALGRARPRVNGA